MPNRTRPPRIYAVDRLRLPRPRQWELRNGIPAYSIELGQAEIVRVEVIFRVGRAHEPQPQVAQATVQLLREGAGSFNAAALSEHFDFYGANLSTPFDLDATQVVLYALNRSLPAVLPVLRELLLAPHFDEHELRAFVRRQQSALREDLQKSDTVAYRQITEYFFGEQHPYGYNSNMESLAALQRDRLVDFHRQYLHAGNALVILSGRVTAAAEQLVDQYLGDLPTGPTAALPALPAPPTQPQYRHHQWPSAHQTAIKLGRRLFPRTHPDYAGMEVLTNVLGGYFGSRLMENIREERGYTYDIGAMLDTMRWDGALHIGAEVSNEHIADTFHEIDRELLQLIENPIPKTELKTVRNYLMGTYLTMLDGPFNVADTLRGYLVEEAPVEGFDQLIDTVLSISPLQLQQLAQQYLSPQEFWRVTVGPEEMTDKSQLQ